MNIKSDYRANDRPASGETSLEAAITDYVNRSAAGEVSDVATFLSQHSGLGDEIRAFFANFLVPPPDAISPAGEKIEGNSLAEDQAARLLLKQETHDPCAARPPLIGRYVVKKVLGIGGFGVVYLAHDGQLQRAVAIKVPHRIQVSTAEAADAYLSEARIVASLDHPHIVPVFDIGSTSEWPCFIVSKFIEGCTLTQQIKNNRPTAHATAELIATLAEALHYAHMRGLTHRDIKPGNILIDPAGKPYLVDFGLALKEENVGCGPKQAGTPAYMSPEQARGEGHRVDGRSDIFSLGIVFYEMLVGRTPFRADSFAELMERITCYEPRPPRQCDDSIPPELERICLKSLAKRASERYSTARDMAEDLRHFLAQQSDHATALLNSPKSRSIEPPEPPLASSSDFAAQQVSDSTPIKIVPKGLRSFDAYDADFFLELMPGPRDREGLPDCIRFWKNRIEEPDAQQTFAIGLICGPSGCGKSSLVKAGLLPRLSPNVLAIYVEATAADTEARLLGGLRKLCPALPADLDLTQSLAALRRGDAVPPGKKVLIILDQFEQWLHARKEAENTALVRALRQCEASRVQAIVMVRDDFWMAVIRFMRELEIHLVEGHNSSAVDLFPIRHAEKVLEAFGRAFGALPEAATALSGEQKQFITQAVASLAQDNKVICVRLALFAEMMKGKVWTLAALHSVGGAEGVGVTFLEESFGAGTSFPEHRFHQQAARAVLSALLPESGSDIKGHLRSCAELLDASGYAGRPQYFDELIRILDSETRLITPTELEAEIGAGQSAADGQLGPRYYQLTHDYLVPSLRQWLTRKQKETRRGRAELMLADRASDWNARPENRHLPSLVQWCQILAFTSRQDWTAPQRRMMGRGGQFHGLRSLALVLFLSLVGYRLYTGYGSLQAQALRDRLLTAKTTEVPAILSDAAAYRRWLDPLLRTAAHDPNLAKDARKQLNLSLAQLPVDASQAHYLFNRLLEGEPHEYPVIRDALASHLDDALLGKLWEVAAAPENTPALQRLSAAGALANYDRDNPRWADVQDAVAHELVQVPAVFLSTWIESLRPVRLRLLAPLSEVYGDETHGDAERSLVTGILADYAADQPEVLANLLMDANVRQFAVVFPKFMEQAEQGRLLLAAEIQRQLPVDAPEAQREATAKRQANAAVALLRLGQTQGVWQCLSHRSDPRMRSYLIHRLSLFGMDAQALIDRVEGEDDISIQRALVLSLGEFAGDQLPLPKRAALIPKLQAFYCTAPDPGLHAAAEWLLRTWDQGDWIERTNAALAKENARPSPQWYFNSQGQTMIVLARPGEFVMGSPASESGRYANETQHTARIDRGYALSAHHVTVEQFQRFSQDYEPPAVQDRIERLPAVGISWYMAATYCNWLSKVEGIPEDQWCYEIISPEQIRLRVNNSALIGYRLPTEAEMEFATRAGASTSRYYGESAELLPKYAWYQNNSLERTQPVGRLKPNDLGFFDMHGNAWAWCQDVYRMQPGDSLEPANSQADDLDVDSKVSRVLKGGSFLFLQSIVRSAFRNDDVPSSQGNDFGFRVAKTVQSSAPPISSAACVTNRN